MRRICVHVNEAKGQTHRPYYQRKGFRRPYVMVQGNRTESNTIRIVHFLEKIELHVLVLITSNQEK